MAADAGNEDWRVMFGAKVAIPSDMNADKVRQIIMCAKETLADVPAGADPEQRHSMLLKHFCEDKFNDTWMVVIGRNFGCYCIHESKNFLFFYHGQCVCVCVLARSLLTKRMQVLPLTRASLLTL